MDNEADVLRDWRNHLAESLSLIGRWHMPFGKYGPQHYPPRGLPLCDLPAEYVLWFQHNGFPAGRLGEVLKVICEIYMCGAEAVFEPMRRANGGRVPLRPKRRKDFDFRDQELPLD